MPQNEAEADENKYYRAGSQNSLRSGQQNDVLLAQRFDGGFVINKKDQTVSQNAEFIHKLFEGALLH